MVRRMEAQTQPRIPSARAGVGAAAAVNLPWLVAATFTGDDAVAVMALFVVIASFFVGLFAAIATPWRRFGVGLALGTVGVYAASVALFFAFLIIFVAPHLS